jgi:hypothetical protein
MKLVDDPNSSSNVIFVQLLENSCMLRYAGATYCSRDLVPVLCRDAISGATIAQILSRRSEHSFRPPSLDTGILDVMHDVWNAHYNESQKAGIDQKRWLVCVCTSTDTTTKWQLSDDIMTAACHQWLPEQIRSIAWRLGSQEVVFGGSRRNGAMFNFPSTKIWSHSQTRHKWTKESVSPT